MKTPQLIRVNGQVYRRAEQVSLDGLKMLHGLLSTIIEKHTDDYDALTGTLLATMTSPLNLEVLQDYVDTISTPVAVEDSDIQSSEFFEDTQGIPIFKRR